MKFEITKTITNTYDFSVAEAVEDIHARVVDTIDDYIADYSYLNIDNEHGYRDLTQENYNKIFNEVAKKLVFKLCEDMMKTEKHTEYGLY